VRWLVLHPTSELPDDTAIEQIRLPWFIRRTLADAGLKTVGNVRNAADETLLELKLNRGVVNFIRLRWANTRSIRRLVELGLKAKAK